MSEVSRLSHRLSSCLERREQEADPDYKLVVKQTLTLKPQDLFIHANLCTGIRPRTLPRDVL